MFDSTLDLFCHNEILDDRQHMIDLMRDVYWEGMNLGVNEDRHADAIACDALKIEYCIRVKGISPNATHRQIHAS